MALLAVGMSLALALTLALALLAFVEGRRPFLPPGADPARHRFSGAGGDPRILRALADAGIRLGSLGDYSVGELRASLERAVPELAARVVILRGRVIHNFTRRGVPGFLVTPHGASAGDGPVLRSAAGEELSPAITERSGAYTLVGLPRDVEITNVLERPGFLELAYTTRTTCPGDYEQEYVGTVPAWLARPSSAGDPSRPFAASRAEGHGRGEIALTAVFELSPPDADDHGFVTAGKYEGLGVPGVTFRVWRAAQGADETAADEAPAAGENGIVYADTAAGLLERRVGAWTRRPVRWLCRLGLRRAMTGFEWPARDLAHTSSLGLALVRSLPAGRYEVEARHPTLRCLPTRDAWRCSDPGRAGLEIVSGTLGDVRFYCLPPETGSRASAASATGRGAEDSGGDRCADAR